MDLWRLRYDVARSMIVEETRRHFDPDLVDAFIEHENEFLAVRESHAEAEPALV